MSDPKIPGGYYIKARAIQKSNIMRQPPHVREIWDYLLMNANHSDRKYGGYSIKRGQLFRTYKQIREDLSWNVGWRKETYNENQTKKAMKFLREALMIDTTKEPGGVLITICNYELYQDPRNYERTSERTNERTIDEPSTNQPAPYNKNVEEVKKGKEDNIADSVPESANITIEDENGRKNEKTEDDPRKNKTNYTPKDSGKQPGSPALLPGVGEPGSAGEGGGSGGLDQVAIPSVFSSGGASIPGSKSCKQDIQQRGRYNGNEDSGRGDGGNAGGDKKKEEPKYRAIPYKEIITHLNDLTGKSFKAGSKKTRSLIKARWNEGWSLEDFKSVIEAKTGQWLTDDKMLPYLRPQTLFNGNFEAYLNEQPKTRPKVCVDGKVVTEGPKIDVKREMEKMRERAKQLEIRDANDQRKNGATIQATPVKVMEPDPGANTEPGTHEPINSTLRQLFG